MSALAGPGSFSFALSTPAVFERPQRALRPDAAVMFVPDGAPFTSGDATVRDVGYPAKSRPMLVLDPTTGFGYGSAGHSPQDRAWHMTEYELPMSLADVLHVGYRAFAARYANLGAGEAGSRIRIVLTCPPWDGAFVRAKAVAWSHEDVAGWDQEPGRAPYTATDTDTGTSIHGAWVKRQAPTPLTVEVQMCRSWTGRDVTDPVAYWWAWHRLDGALMDAWQKDQKHGTTTALMASPSTTGVRLFRASVGTHPRRVDRRTGEVFPARPMAWDLPSDEVRDLLKATSGQGRIELCTYGVPDRVPAVTHVDGRFMYAALLWDLPVGEPSRVTARSWQNLSESERVNELRGGRQWLRVRATIPSDWDHVGLLPARRDVEDRAWCYPDEPGRTFTTWASGAEIHLAHTYGWRIEVTDGLRWEAGRPLEVWRKRLMKIWTETNDPIVHKMIRSIVLQTIGTFGASLRREQRRVDRSSGELVEGFAEPVGDVLLYERMGDLSEQAAAVAHTPMAVTVWGRARARLLYAEVNKVKQPDGSYRGRPVGALTVPRSAVLGFHTDSLLLGQRVDWPDDGKIGTLRIKGLIPEDHPHAIASGGIPAPRTHSERLALQALADDIYERDGYVR